MTADEVIALLDLSPYPEGGRYREIFRDEPGARQAARSFGAFTLVGCAVAPGFKFAKFELAPTGFLSERGK